MTLLIVTDFTLFLQKAILRKIAIEHTAETCCTDQCKISSFKLASSFHKLGK